MTDILTASERAVVEDIRARNADGPPHHDDVRDLLEIIGGRITVPAEAPAPVCLACSGAPEHGGCAGCSGGECGCQCRASVPAEVARVTPAVEVRASFTVPGRVVAGGIDPVTQCRRSVAASRWRLTRARWCRRWNSASASP